MATKAVTAIGRRKASSARVTILTAEGGSEESTITINGRTLNHYFPGAVTRMTVMKPLEVAERVGKYNFNINVLGGGSTGQAGAIVLGIARALQKVEPELRAVLKKAGFLTRDPRVVERKKPGKHKARKSTQFSKR